MNKIQIFIGLLISISASLISWTCAASEDKSNFQAGFAQVVDSKELPNGSESKINAEYESGKSSYKTPVKLISKIVNKKTIKINIDGETYSLIAFPELVHLTEGFGENGVDAQSTCDVIQYRQKEDRFSILPKEDVEGECITYFLAKPMTMDLDQDGYPDIVFFGSFKQPQTGGNVSSPKFFLFNKNTHSFCYSAKGSEYRR